MNDIVGILNQDMVFSLIVLAAALLAGVVSSLIIELLLKPLRNRTVFNKIRIPPSSLHGPLCSIITSGFLLFAIPMLRFPDRVNVYIGAIAKVWLIVSFGWLIIRAIHVGGKSFLSMYDITVSDNLKARTVYTQVRVIENIAVIIIVFLTIAFVLMSFEGIRQIGTGLLASAGILGMIVGLGAQKTIGNLIAGTQIAFTQPIRLDDVVIVENEWGRIEEITLTYVVVRIWDLRRLVLPISYFLERPFQNWTRISADILGTVFIYADYTVPVDSIREELTRILENDPLWDRKVNVLQITDAKEHTLEIRALMSAADASKAWDLRCRVREQMIVFLQKNFPECLPKTRVELTREQVK